MKCFFEAASPPLTCILHDCPMSQKWDMMCNVAFSWLSSINQSACSPLDSVIYSQLESDWAAYKHHQEFLINEKISPMLHREGVNSMKYSPTSPLCTSGRLSLFCLLSLLSGSADLALMNSLRWWYTMLLYSNLSGIKSHVISHFTLQLSDVGFLL